MIIVSISEKDISDWSEFWIIIFVAVVIDIILLWLAMAKIMPPIGSSFQLMRSGLKNRRIAKKESAKLKKLLKSEELDVNRLQELRDKRISESATKRTLHFCQLINNIVGKEQLQDCLSAVREKQSVLDEINNLENRILKVAENCKNAGNIKKCKYYLDILKTTKITPDITRLENDCEEQLLRRERESKAIRSWQKGICCLLVILVTIFAILFIQDTPYRELRSMIRDQSLTAEMCNRNSEESYYEYLDSEKGHKLIASELTKLHKNDDVIKAMWLLCIQPDCIDGYYLSASPSFINWIVDYAKHNGVRNTDQKGDYGLLYFVTYSVDDYQITLSSYYDNMSTIKTGGFDISNGDEQVSVNTKVNYAKENIPTIE